MFNAESLQEKWSPVLNNEAATPIADRYKKAVTSVLLENQERFLREERGMLNEVADNSLGAGTIAPAGSALGSSCLLYTSPSPRDATLSRMPSSA